MNVLNDPYLSSEERNFRLQEFHGISSDGVVSYEVSDKSTTKEYTLERMDLL